MGNACGCADDKDKTGEATGNLNQSSPAAPAYKIANYQSKVAPSFFASFSNQDKDTLLADAFSLLVSSVESQKIMSNNLYVKKLTSKDRGQAANPMGETYQGEFINGLASGRGTIKSADGTQYEGQMFNGVRHGDGKVTEIGLDARSYRTAFLAGQPIGNAVQQSVDRSEHSGTLQGGFDYKGQQSGPYLMEYHDKTLAYYTQQADLPDGPHVFVTNGGKHIILSDYKADIEVGTPKTYTLGTEVQAQKTDSQAQPPAQPQAQPPAQPQAQHQAQPPAQPQGHPQATNAATVEK